MNVNELREQEVTALHEQLKTLAHKQFQLRMSHRTGQLKDTSQIRAVRRDIARVYTILREKQT